MLPQSLPNRTSRVGFLQDSDDLRFREPALSHADPPGRASTQCDVGPETLQVLARKRGRFDGRYSLTLGDELVRCQVPERAVWATLIVVDAPRFDLRFRILDRALSSCSRHPAGDVE